MSNLKGKQGSSKKKTIIIVSSALVVLIGLGAGLGVAFGGTSGKASDDTNSDNIIPLTKITASTPFSYNSYWESVEETDPNDSSKKIKVLRINKVVKTEEQLKKAYDNMISKKVDLTSFNELLLPYHFKKNKVTEEKVKEALHMDTFNNNNIGYILHKEDYDESFAIIGQGSRTGGYKQQKLAEVNLPESIEELPDQTFNYNKIKKVNWSELTKLKSIGTDVFNNNELTGDLDLSGLTSLTSIGEGAFISNNLNGTLKLPPNIATIGEGSFNSYSGKNKIKGTLKLPKSLKSIGFEAFVSNNIEVLDWSDAESLVDIQDNAFAFNKLKTLQFNATTLPKIKAIKRAAFLANTGQNSAGELITKDVTLPPSLQTIGQEAIKVKNGITITVSVNATGVTVASFEGTPIIKKPTL